MASPPYFWACGTLPDWVVYTDASFADERAAADLAAVVSRSMDCVARVAAEVLLTSTPSLAEQQGFSHAPSIFGLKLGAVVLTPSAWLVRFAHHRLTSYIDNNATLSAIIRAVSSAPIGRLLLFLLLFFFFFLLCGSWPPTTTLACGSSGRNPLATLPICIRASTQALFRRD